MYDLGMYNPVQWGREHYLFSTSVIALITAAFDIKILFMMFESFDKGLGLAAIGITSFFGVLLSSSFFEEHRHPHGNKESDIDYSKIPTEEAKKIKDKINNLDKSGSTLIFDIIAGRGIMRKALAASLVITYIVLIGLSFSTGTLYNPIDGGDDKDTISTGDGDNTNSTGAGDVRTQSPDININLENIGITNIQEYDKIQIKKTNQSSNSIEELILEKEPSTLVEHYTIVISVVIGFYFGTNTLTALIKNRKSDTGNLSKKISEIEEKLAKTNSNDSISDEIKEIKDSISKINKKIKGP